MIKTMEKLLRPTTIAKIFQNSRVNVGLNIASTTQDIRIFKNFYNLSVYDVINFEDKTLETEYSGFYQTPKWLRKKLFDLTNNNSVPGLIVVKMDENGEINFNEYQYSFKVTQKFDEINMLDSYDHLNNLKDYKRELAKTRNLIKAMSIEEIKESSSIDDKNVYTLWPNTPTVTY
jgi:hypothetical protein